MHSRRSKVGDRGVTPGKFRVSTASTSTQLAILPWRYDAEMDTAKSLNASA